MIKGMHGMFYTSEPDALRAFFKDKLELPFTDVGEGWLIFNVPAADVGVHPDDHEGSPPSGTHDVSFFCDDLEATVGKLEAKGVEFLDDIRDDGWGLTIRLEAPGGVRLQLYQPKYG